MILKKYFDDSIDFPGKKLLAGLVPGTDYCYVSSSYVNGILNFATPVFGAVLGRYAEMDVVFDEPREIGYYTPGDQHHPSTRKVFKYTTKREILDFLQTKPELPHHQEFDIFQDDVLILAQTEVTAEDYVHFSVYEDQGNQPDGTKKAWIYFWLDRDCSDCGFGLFFTDDPYEIVINEFIKNVADWQIDRNKPDQHRFIDMSLFKGWHKW